MVIPYSVDFPSNSGNPIVVIQRLPPCWVPFLIIFIPSSKYLLKRHIKGTFGSESSSLAWSLKHGRFEPRCWVWFIYIWVGFMSYASRNSSISLDGLAYMEPFTFMEESWKEVMEARIDDGSTRVWEGTTFGTNFYRKLCMKPVYFLSEIRVSVSTWWDTFRALTNRKFRYKMGPY